MPAEERTENIWPLPKFSFQVTFEGGLVMAFQEVSGLDTGANPIEYRKGDSAKFAVRKMPGLRKFGNITMKRGMMITDNRFTDLHNAIKLNTVERSIVTISLLDERGNTAMQWKLKNAFPTKITTSDFKASGNEVAIETLEFAHEGISIGNNDE